MGNSASLFGHPRGLFVLFMTEMWERFSYYGMRAILVFYMIAQTQDSNNPGLGWDHAEALSLYGWYTMAVYIACIPGGILADRWLGQKKSVYLGGLLLCAGHSVLAINFLWAFYLGLVLITLGVGCLKPNISTMVGGLYAADDPRREKGFSIFYMGINCGAFLATIIVGYVGERIGWHYGFGLAGIGMLCGQLVFMRGQKHLKGVGEALKKTSAAVSEPLTKIEKDRVKVLLLSFLIVIVFWGAFEQAGGLLNIYAMEKTERNIFSWEVPASFFQSLNPLFIIIFAVAVASIWQRRQLRKKESSSLYKMAIGTLIMGSGFLLMSAASIEADYSSTQKSAMFWLVFAHFLFTIGELCLSPVALSFITKLAPLKYSSLIMGSFFAASGLGNKVAGLLGEAATFEGELGIFGGIFLFCTAFSLLLLVFLKKLKAMTHGADTLLPERSEEYQEELSPKKARA